MGKQLKGDGKIALAKHLNSKIELADLEMRKLMNNFTEDKETKEIIWGEPINKPYPEILRKKIDNLWSRIETFQLSLRLIHNTGWISEWRDEHIKVEKDNLTKMQMEHDTLFKSDADQFESNETLKNNQKRLETVKIKINDITKKINDLTRAKKCNRTGCHGRGYLGFNISLGEYSLCACTIKTKHYFNVKKTQD